MRTLDTHLPVPFYRGLPEVTFGVDEVKVSGGQSLGTMTTTLQNADDNTGLLHQGSLGVLIDDTSAYAALTGRSADQWGVSSVINVDFHAPARRSSAQFECQAGFVARDGNWGFSSGSVCDSQGALVATIEQRMRYLPGDSSPHEQPWATVEPGLGDRQPDSLLALAHSDARRAEFRLNSGPELSNPLGSLHGGLGLYFSELAARKAWNQMVGETGPRFHTSNLRTTYLRPGDLNGDVDIRVQVIHASRSFAVLEVVIHNPDGRPAIFSLSTLHRSEGKWVRR